MSLLKQFIQEVYVFNYWMRRPRNSIPPDLSNPLEQDRSNRYQDAVLDFGDRVKQLEQAISNANSMQELHLNLHSFDVDPLDLVADPSVFDTDDYVLIKNSMLVGLDRWHKKMLDSTKQDYDVFTLDRI